MIKKIFCVFLIVFGITLDTYFYSFRFSADGLPFAIAIASGVGLELLLSFAVYNAKQSKIFAAIAVAITLYAVVQTAAGQTFALLSHEANAGTAKEGKTADFAIENSKQNITRLSAEADSITVQLKSLQSAEARTTYATTIAHANKRLIEIEKERSKNMAVLLKTTTSAADAERTGEAKKSIYAFYSGIPDWDGSDWLKFIFHFILSVLIAIMAPVGIITWGGKTAAQVAFTKQQIELFVASAWFKIRNNTSMSILSEVAFCELLQKRGVPVETGLYFSLVNRCMDLGLINTSGVATERNYLNVIKKLSGSNETRMIEKFSAMKEKVKNLFERRLMK